jgi:hypothetical protein
MVHRSLHVVPRETSSLTTELANPVFAGFYAYTNELSQFQKELTESFGPEQAKAIAFGKGCFHVIQHRVGPRSPAE